ncbi:PREDICTED: V-set and immunoglobulin domain-containing protein 4-like, partial [Buceros rhinoceros silvestris]|uniref:V-set and immunoglobulin domain-containing protein 4-like n=1 Tax=Buceros rhinoceros silvestris TaxID=175836 RepID=UPI0005282E55
MEVVRTVVFATAFISCNALPDLSGVHQVQGMWMGSTTLQCTYVPSEGFTEQVLTWSLERDHSTSTIFRRDESGDHILLSQFRDRISVPKHSPGNASLLIENLEIPDSGHYTCQVTWRSDNNNLVTKEVTTTVKVVKGEKQQLSHHAVYPRPGWVVSPGGKAQRVSRQAELAWDNLRPSDTGTYYCEAENRAGAGAVQRSDAVQLTVRGSPVTEQPSPGTGRHGTPPLTRHSSVPRRVPT